MTSPDVDYRAEVARTRAAQGLDPNVPQDVRDAVAALIGGDPVDTNTTRKTTVTK